MSRLITAGVTSITLMVLLGCSVNTAEYESPDRAWLEARVSIGHLGQVEQMFLYRDGRILLRADATVFRKSHLSPIEQSQLFQIVESSELQSAAERARPAYEEGCCDMNDLALSGAVEVALPCPGSHVPAQELVDIALLLGEVAQAHFGAEGKEFRWCAENLLAEHPSGAA